MWKELFYHVIPLPTPDDRLDYTEVMRPFIWFALVIIGLSACGPSVIGSAPTTTAVLPANGQNVIDLDAIPPVDTTQHSVPLEEIYFDTFRPTNRAVPLSKADPDLIRSLRDAIPPLYAPVFESAAEADGWLEAADIVLGYADGEEAYAYPVRILNFHEIVSHEVNGRPIIATYCPLCYSGVVYDRRVKGEMLLFGNTSALHESDMVMLDHQTGSYWVQVSGEAMVGPMTGTRLTPLPAQMATWADWQDLHPDTLVLSRNTGYQRDYGRNPFAGYAEQLNQTSRFAFPVSDAVNDPRLAPGDVVLGGRDWGGYGCLSAGSNWGWCGE